MSKIRKPITDQSVSKSNLRKIEDLSIERERVYDLKFNVGSARRQGWTSGDMKNYLRSMGELLAERIIAGTATEGEQKFAKDHFNRALKDARWRYEREASDAATLAQDQRITGLGKLGIEDPRAAE